MAKKSKDYDSFGEIFGGDLIAVRKLYEEADTPTNRRQFVRAAFACVDGLSWQMQLLLTEVKAIKSLLTPAEIKVLEGDVIPLKKMVKLIVKVVPRFSTKLGNTTEDSKWVREGVELRGRLDQPRTTEDLAISKTDIRVATDTWISFNAAMSVLHKKIVEYAAKQAKPSE